jgi:Bardet-Biedl syndrome 9 protein
MIAVVTDQGSLLIYDNSMLVWSATLPLHPTVALQRGNFSELNGALVMLSDTGKISVGYLGSNPVMFKVPPLNLANLNYENSKVMLEEMEKEINSSIDVQGCHVELHADLTGSLSNFNFRLSIY